MPLVDIDDDVFATLQSLAIPLVDTPSDVIRRLLGGRPDNVPTPTKALISTNGTQKVANGRGRSVRKFGQGIQMKEYRPYILKALLIEDGRAHLSKVKDYVRAHIGQRFDAHDLDLTQSNAIVWENRVEWQRLEMRQHGLIKAGSPKGIWELTPKGLEEAKKVSLPG